MSPQGKMDDRRAFLRQDLHFQAALVLGDADFPCHVLDMSAGGACVGLRTSAEPGELAVLKLDSFGDLKARVAWVKRDRIGLSFDEDPTVVGELLMGLAIYG